MKPEQPVYPDKHPKQPNKDVPRKNSGISPQKISSDAKKNPRNTETIATEVPCHNQSKNPCHNQSKNHRLEPVSQPVKKPVSQPVKKQNLRKSDVEDQDQDQGQKSQDVKSRVQMKNAKT